MPSPYLTPLGVSQPRTRQASTPPGLPRRMVPLGDLLKCSLAAGSGVAGARSRAGSRTAAGPSSTGTLGSSPAGAAATPDGPHSADRLAALYPPQPGREGISPVASPRAPDADAYGGSGSDSEPQTHFLSAYVPGGAWPPQPKSLAHEQPGDASSRGGAWHDDDPHAPSYGRDSELSPAGSSRPSALPAPSGSRSLAHLLATPPLALAAAPSAASLALPLPASPSSGSAASWAARGGPPASLESHVAAAKQQVSYPAGAVPWRGHVLLIACPACYVCCAGGRRGSSVEC